jgi:hypothetical protein
MLNTRYTRGAFGGSIFFGATHVGVGQRPFFVTMALAMVAGRICPASDVGDLYLNHFGFQTTDDPLWSRMQWIFRINLAVQSRC